LAAKRKKRGTWGGARPGSGRKPYFDESADLTVRFPKEDVDALVSLATARGVSAGELVREAVHRYVSRRKG
jgi:hypothetical protein